jgi:ferric-dicitrate binding protein FerR (iron transport regulator)
LCDEAVDPEMSVNDQRGPSIDSVATKAKGDRSRPGVGGERLAHRGCNTRKGAVAPVVSWPDRFFVVDPAPIIATVERLRRKGGREIMARCPTVADGEVAGEWLVDRISRLCPDLPVSVNVTPGGGQFLLILQA